MRAIFLPLGTLGRTVQLFAAIVISAALSVAIYAGLVLWAVPRHDMPSSYKWLLLEDATQAPRLIIEGGSSGHHGIDTDSLGQALGVTAINIADNAGYDLIDKVARLERFARAGDTVVLQLEWSYYLRDTVTDDYLSVLFASLPDYLVTQPITGQVRRAMSVPVPVLWPALNAPLPATPVMTAAQQLDIAALQGPSGHVSYATARPLAAGVAEQSCDSYLFSNALAQGGLDLSPLFLAALDRLKGLQDHGVRVLFAWPIVVGDDCYTSDIGLPDLQSRVQGAVTAAGFTMLGAMTDTLFAGDLRDDTPYHLITEGAARRTALLTVALRAQGVIGAGGLDLKALARADILAREARQPDPAHLVSLPMDRDLPLGHVSGDQVRFAAGWWQDEESGRWMRGREAVLTLALDPGLPADRMLTLAGFTFDGQARRLVVFHDGRQLAEAAVQGEFALPVATAGLPRGRPLRLTLRLMDDAPVQSPAELGRGADDRTLALHLRRLSLVPAASVPNVAPLVASLSSAPAVACLPTGDAASCQAPPALTAEAALPELDAALRAVLTDAPLPQQIRLSGGWWGAEAGGRWIGAQGAAITLHPAAALGPVALRLSVRPFQGVTMPLRIMAGERTVYEGEFDASTPITVALPQDMAGQEVTLVLQFPEAIVHCPKSLGLGDDTRGLLAFVTAIEVVAQSSM